MVTRLLAVLSVSLNCAVTSCFCRVSSLAHESLKGEALAGWRKVRVVQWGSPARSYRGNGSQAFVLYKLKYTSSEHQRKWMNADAWVPLRLQHPILHRINIGFLKVDN